jgi:hypothetical protein
VLIRSGSHPPRIKINSRRGSLTKLRSIHKPDVGSGWLPLRLADTAGSGMAAAVRAGRLPIVLHGPGLEERSPKDLISIICAGRLAARIHSTARPSPARRTSAEDGQPTRLAYVAVGFIPGCRRTSSSRRATSNGARHVVRKAKAARKGTWQGRNCAGAPNPLPTEPSVLR